MKFYLFTAACSLALLLVPPAEACRYTVRDAGFVRIGPVPYRLCLFVDENTAEGMDATLLPRTARAFGNITVETIDLDKQGSHPAIRYLPPGSRTPPVAVLVSVDGRSLVIPFSEQGEAGDGSLPALGEDVTASPARSEIVKSVVESHCVVVMVPGKDAAANREALDAVNAAIEKCAGLMSMMIRPRGTAPRLVTIPREKIDAEKILLWSLGIDPAGPDEPHVAVLYGRCRRIGPLLSGERIKERILVNIFMVVGEDCECDLDRRLLMGLMIPHEWRDESTARVQEMLGFNPENPVVRMEVSQIMSMGPGSQTSGAGMPDPFEDRSPYGYSEQVITFETEPVAETAAIDAGSPGTERSTAPSQPAEPSGGTATDPPQSSKEGEKDDSPYKNVPFMIIVIAVAIAAGLVLIVARARLKQR